MSDPFIAMLALEKHTTLFSSQIVGQIKTMFPDFADKVEAVETDVPKVVADEAVMFRMMDVPFTVMFMDVPLPDGTLDQAIATNRIWPTAKQDLSRHRAHVIVAPLSEADGFHNARRLACITTLCTAAIAAMTPCIGVYWAAGDTVSEKGAFQRTAETLAKDDEALPILQWIQMMWLDGPKSNDGQRQLAVRTTGMHPFIGRELELEPVPLQPSVIGQRMYGVLAYLLTYGPVVKDGDTIGLSKDEKIGICHSREGWKKGVPVMKLKMPESNKMSPTA